MKKQPKYNVSLLIDFSPSMSMKINNSELQNLISSLYPAISSLTENNSLQCVLSGLETKFCPEEITKHTYNKYVETAIINKISYGVYKTSLSIDEISKKQVKSTNKNIIIFITDKDCKNEIEMTRSIQSLDYDKWFIFVVALSDSNNFTNYAKMASNIRSNVRFAKVDNKTAFSIKFFEEQLQAWTKTHKDNAV